MVSSKNSIVVRCHVHKEKITKKCELSKCLFFTKYPNTHNCILVYMAKHDMTALKPIDIGMLKGVEAHKISRILSKATVSMRNSTLKVSNQAEIEPRFVTLEGQSACYCCESPILGKARKTAIEAKIGINGGKVLYCTSECQELMPPQFIAVEMRCRTDIKTILQWAVKKYSTLGGLEQALGMNRTLLGEALENLLGINAEELYSTTQRVKTRSKALVRRTGSRPEWLSGFNELFLPLIEDMESKYGSSLLNTEEIATEVQNIIDTI